MSEKLTSDIYNVTKFINSMKKNYIDVENEDSLYAGTFGYMGEVFSSLLQNTIIMSSEFSNEVIPTRAKFDRNVLIHAKSLGISKVEATGATMKILLCVPESALLNNLNNSTYTQDDQCLLDSSFPYIIEDREFHLPYDIIITRVENNALQTENKVAYTAEYRLPEGSTENKYLPTIGIFKSDDDNLLILTTSLKQTMYTEIEEHIISDNNITNKTLNFTFTNQLVDFDVVVYEGNATNPTITLTPVYDGLYNTIENYCWYSYMNSNTIRIRFDENSYRPRINSKIIIRVNTTLGSSGNFKYKDDIMVSYNNSTSIAKYSNMYVYVKQRDEGAIGGLDRASVEELRKIIPKERLSRGSITTRTDLDNFFNSFNTEQSTMHVFRKEDNILTRVYYAYALIKDEDSNVIPTNTIPIKVASDDINTTNKKLFVEAGTQILYAKTEDSSYLGRIVTNTWITNGPPTTPFNPNQLLDLSISGLGRSWTVRVDGNTISNKSGTNGRIHITPIYTKEFMDEFFSEPEKITDDSGEEIPNPAYKKFPEEISYSDIIGYRKLDGFLYTLPYSISVYDSDSAGDGRPNCSYYIDALNETYYLNFDYINSNSDIQFIVSNVKVKRPSFLSVDRYTYTMSIDLTPNIGSTAQLDNRFIQCIALIYNKNDKNPIGYSVGQFVEPLEGAETDYFSYEFVLNTKPLNPKTNIPEYATEPGLKNVNTVTQDNRLWIRGLYASNVNDDNNYQKEDKYLTEEISVKIFTFYNYTLPDENNAKTNQRVPDDLSNELYSTVASNFEFSFPNPTKEDPTKVDTYTLADMTITNMYTPMKDIHIFYNYSERLTSYVSVIHPGSNTQYIVNRVPVVRYFYLSNEERLNYFISEVRKKLAHIDMAIDPLETLFGVDFKLFNTYGPSNMYKVTENGLPDKLIDRINLTLNFRTQLYSNTDKSVVYQIKNDIKEYIEDIQSLKDLHMPNLVTKITQNYKDYLIYFEFLGFSNGITQWDANYQHIITDESMDMLTVVPEFLNVNFNDETGEPDINIDIIS